MNELEAKIYVIKLSSVNYSDHDCRYNNENSKKGNQSPKTKMCFYLSFKKSFFSALGLAKKNLKIHFFYFYCVANEYTILVYIYYALMFKFKYTMYLH